MTTPTSPIDTTENALAPNAIALSKEAEKPSALPEWNTQFIELIDSLPENSQGTSKFPALRSHLEHTTEKDFHEGRIDFPLNLPADVFRDYLRALKSALRAECGRPVITKYDIKHANDLLDTIMALSLLTEGEEVPDGNMTYTNGTERRVTPTISILEALLVRNTVLEQDYPLYLKLAEDGGPEYTRLASRLMSLMLTKNFEARVTGELEERESSINGGVADLTKTKDFDCIRLIPAIACKSETVKIDVLFWDITAILFTYIADENPSPGNYQEATDAILAHMTVHFLKYYNAAGRQVIESDIYKFAAICHFLVRILARQDNMPENGEFGEASKELRNRLFEKLGEIIGPEFIQATTKNFELNDENCAKTLGMEQKALIHGIDTCFSILNSSRRLLGSLDVSPEVLIKCYGAMKMVYSIVIRDISALFKKFSKKQINGSPTLKAELQK